MPDPFKKSDTLAQARDWLATASSRWRLQTLQHRSRYNPKTGEYKQLPTRVRRFLNGTPAGMKAAVLQLLKESAPYESPVFDMECDGLRYVPTSTFIRKDGPENVTNGRDATYTIIQDLRLEDGVLDRFGFPDESSCSSYGETEFRWDETDVEGCPDGSQGVVYQIADVSRDRETDLFSYRVRKVQALTQHMPPSVTQCDAKRRVTVETWNNVYGEPGSFRWDPVKGGSASIEVPEPCSQPDGTTVQVTVSENADCTYRVEVAKTEARTLGGQFSVYRDQYKVQEAERVQNAFSPLDRTGVEYSGGVTRRYTSEPNDDGTWTNGVETETERAVPSSTVEVRVMPRHTVRTRVDTNVPVAADAVPGGKYGSYKFTKTQGGLFVNEYVEYLRTHLGDLGLVCSDTAFAKTHETLETADAVPSGSHVPAASGGLVTTWSYDTDAEGIVSKRVRTELEHEVRNAVRRRTWGFLGTTSGYTHRSVGKSVMEGLMSSQPQGTSVEARMTNGALWDVDVQTFLRLTGQSLGLDCQKTVYQHVHEIAVSAAAIGEEASDAGGGMTHRRSFRLDTATGAITQTDTTTYELEVPESRRVVRVTPRGVTVRTTGSGVQSRPPDASRPGETTEFEVTPGGRFNVTLERTEPREGKLARECSKDVFQETDASVRTAGAQDPEHVAAPGGGSYRERSQRLGDDGLWEIRDTETKEKPSVDAGVDVTVTSRGKRRTVKTRQVPVPPAEPGAGDAGRSLRTQKTRGGLWDVEDTTVTPRPGPNGEGCSRDAFVHSDTSTTLDRNKPSGHQSGGTNGQYSERQSKLGDDGLWETTTVTHQEKPVAGGLDVSVTARGKRRTVVTLQTSDQGQEPDVNDAGKSLKRTKTRGGLNNIEQTEFIPRTQKSGKAGSSDIFLSTTESTNLKSAADGDMPQEAGNGYYRERRQRLGDDGLWEVTDTEHKEKQVSKQRQEIRVTRAGKITRTTDVQVNDGGQEPGATIEDIGKELIKEKTRGGKYNITETRVDAIKDKLEHRCEKDAFLHSHSKVEGVKDATDDDVDDAGDGKYHETSFRLNEAGVWEKTTTDHEEKPQGWKGRQYQDAFGSVEVTESTAHESQDGEEGKEYSDERFIRHVEAQMTRGKLYNVKTTTETPKAVDSGWQKFEMTTSKGIGVYYHFIVFRNQKKSWVKSKIEELKAKSTHKGGDGSYANHPSINVSPNKFGLWDGSLANTVTYTPKEWAAGGSVVSDNLDESEYDVVDVQVSPMNAAKSTSDLYLLKATTIEKHIRGGGVGKDRLSAKLRQVLIRGSQFSYHPSGQSFQYDLITSKTIRYEVVRCSGNTYDVVPDTSGNN